MRVLITGVAGFIGSTLARRLLARGDSVVGIDNLNDYYSVALKKDRLAAIRQDAGNRFAFYELDFADHSTMQAALAEEQFDRIVHLGAQAGVRYSIENPHAYVQANLVGHLNMLEIARHRGVEHMVYASSSSVYGGNTKLPFSVDDRVDHPLSLYAATKKADELMSETYAHLYRLPLTGLRFFTVYGPWGRPDMMMWIFTKAILAGEPIPVFNQWRYVSRFHLYRRYRVGCRRLPRQSACRRWNGKGGRQRETACAVQYREQSQRASDESDRSAGGCVRPQGGAANAAKCSPATLRAPMPISMRFQPI